jgi:hypothetical protein
MAVWGRRWWARLGEAWEPASVSGGRLLGSKSIHETVELDPRLIMLLNFSTKVNPRRAFVRYPDFCGTASEQPIGLPWGTADKTVKMGGKASWQPSENTTHGNDDGNRLLQGVRDRTDSIC